MRVSRARRFTAAIAVLGVIATGSCVAAQPNPAQVVLRNGSIYTQSAAKPWVQAAAFRDGKIVATGSDAEIDQYKGAATQVVDLGGKFAMPGINDVHVHVHNAALEIAQYNCPFSQYSTFEEIIEVVRGCAEKTAAGGWIVGAHWNSKLYKRLENAEAIKALDAVSGGHPVVLRVDTNHDIWVNSRALSIGGVTRDTPNPFNGVIGHDPSTGELNGLLIEGSAGSLVTKHSPVGVLASSPADHLKQLEFGLKTLSSFGVTGFQDAAVRAGEVEMFVAAERSGDLQARASLCLLVDPNAPGNLDALFGVARTLTSDRVKADCAKIFLDGVMVSRTAMFLDPYLPDEKHGRDFHGDPKTTSEKLNALVIDLDRRGISVKFHSAGDGAVHQALGAIEAARKANGPRGPMHTIAHGGFIAAGDIPRLKALNAAIDASPTVWFPGPIMEATAALIGPERTNGFLPVKTMLAAGATVAGGTDWKSLPGEFSDLWSGIEGLVTRRNPTGKVEGVLNPNEAVDIATALRIYTVNTAKALRISEVTGTLEPGKSADVIVLDRNPFKIAPEELSETKVLKTFFAGKLVYERK